MCLACVYEFFVLEVLLQGLYHLDAVFDVVSGVLEDNFADLLALVGTLADERAVGAEEVLEEEFVEFVLRAVIIFVDPVDQHLGEQHGVGEGTVDGAETAEENEEEREEGRALSSRVVEGIKEEAVLFDVVLEFFDEVESKPVAHLVDLVEEGIHHVVLDLQFVELRTVFRILGHELSDLVMEHIGYGLLAPAAQLVVRLLMNGMVTAEAGVDVASGG